MAWEQQDEGWADIVAEMLVEQGQFAFMYNTKESGSFLVNFKAISEDGAFLFGEVQQPVDLAEGQIREWLEQYKQAEEPLYIMISRDGTHIRPVTTEEKTQYGL